MTTVAGLQAALHGRRSDEAGAATSAAGKRVAAVRPARRCLGRTPGR